MSYKDLQDRLLDAADCENIECVTEFRALSAVIELHKPDSLNECVECSHDFINENYPCPTIQAIEKELFS